MSNELTNRVYELCMRLYDGDCRCALRNRGLCDSLLALAELPHSIDRIVDGEASRLEFNNTYRETTRPQDWDY